MKAKKQDAFAWLQSHKYFLLDNVRNDTYFRAIHKSAKRGKTAFEIGGGTGILSLFAAKAGFEKVVAVEKSSLATYANMVAKDNHLEDKVEFVCKDLFRFKGSAKFDVLIHEQIGTFLWDEGMVRKVAFAKKRLLRKGGTILPYQIDLHLVPIALTSHDNHPFFWEIPRHGISFKSFRKLEELQQKRKPVIRVVRLEDEKTYLAKPKKVASTNFYRSNKIPRKISATFSLRRRSVLTGFLGYMTVHLDSEHRFSNNPGSSVHWGQFYFALPTSKIFSKSKVSVNLYPSDKPDRWKWDIS